MSRRGRKAPSVVAGGPEADADALPPLSMTDGERLDEVARILALGIVRLQLRQIEGDSVEVDVTADQGAKFGVDFGSGQSVCASEPETNGEHK